MNTLPSREIYILIPYGAEWEDIVIYIEKELAIAASKRYPNYRVEIFKEIQDGFEPSYCYYKNGELITN